MKVEFADGGLARICTDEAHRLRLPFAIIKGARRRLIQLEAASSERELMNLRGLNYKRLQGHREGQCQIWINHQYRIIFTLSDGNPQVITIVEIDDPH